MPMNDIVTVTLWNNKIVVITASGAIYMWKEYGGYWSWQSVTYLPNEPQSTNRYRY